jgi:hypothetical protein
MAELRGSLRSTLEEIGADLESLVNQYRGTFGLKLNM